MWLWYVGCNLFFSFWFSRRKEREEKMKKVPCMVVLSTYSVKVMMVNGGGWQEVIHNVSLPASKLAPASLPDLLKKGWYLPACQVCGEQEGGEKNCKSQAQVDHLQLVGTIGYIWKRGVWESWRTPTCNTSGLLTWPKYSSCLSLTPCREEAVPRHADARQPRTKSSYKNIKICSALTNFDG